MVWFILAIILFVVAAGAVITAFVAEYKGAPIITAAVTAVLGFVLLFIASFWANGVGEAKVMVNSVDRTEVGTIEVAGSGFKPAWVDFVEFDLFSQELVFAGGDGGSPSYTGGTVNGREITASVGGVSGGSTKANVDMTFVYSVDPDAISEIYNQYKSQERFTEQVVLKTVLSTARQVPSQYTAIEFRGSARGDAETEILKTLNEKLGKYGIEFSSVTIQDVRYDPAVEEALTKIEQSNQAAQQAEADQRTRAVEAETALIVAKGKADALVEAARGEAEANREIAKSLTPEVLEQRKIDALVEAAKGGNLIVDGGGSGILLNK